MSSPPRLDIVIVNWNSREQLHACLASIETSDRRALILDRVCIVDNDSQDDSLDGIGKYRLPIMSICNNRNRGFAAACNQGVTGSQADYLLFLNPDTKLFRASLSLPSAFMANPGNEEVGIVGIQLVDDAGNVARTCARFPSPGHIFSKMFGLNRLFPKVFTVHFMWEWDHSETRSVDHVMGAYFLVRRVVFESLGGFDERFFVYLEDLDFSYRALQNGWKSVYLASTQAYHAGGGTSEQVKALSLFYSLRSRILYSYKHFRFLPATAIMMGTLLIEPLLRLALATVRGSIQDAGRAVRAHGLLFAALKSILRDAWHRNQKEN